MLTNKCYKCNKDFKLGSGSVFTKENGTEDDMIILCGYCRDEFKRLLNSLHYDS